MLTVKQFLEHCDPQQKVAVYPGNSGMEQSGKAKDMLKECWYLDNEVTEFYLSAINKDTIGVKSRQPLSFEKHGDITYANINKIISNMTDVCDEERLHSRYMTGTVGPFDITISISKRV